MNRRERRTLDSIHRNFLSTLPTRPKDTPKVEETKARFFRWLDEKHKKGERADVAYGVMKEAEGANAYVEEIVYPPEGGCELKLWGIDYRLKLNRQGMKLHMFDLAKSLVSGIPRDILGRSTLLLLSFGFVAFFQKKKMLLILDELFFTILHRNLRWTEIPQKELNPASREVRRASFAVLKRHGMDLESYKFGPKGASDFTFPPADGTILHLVAEFVLFLVFFLEVDMAYRLRFQDAFAGDIGNILKTLLSRETSEGIGHKWKWVRRILKLALWRYGEIGNLVKSILTEIDPEKVKMDEADRYFSLGYISYNFGGRSFEDRWLERQEIDRIHEHILFYAY